MIKLPTASQLDRAMTCSMSNKLLQIGTVTDASEAGTERHKEIEAYINSNRQDKAFAFLDPILSNKMETEVSFTICLDGRVVKHRGAIEGFQGTMDAIDLSRLEKEKIVTIIDWKTGNSFPEPTTWQLKFGAIAVAGFYGAEIVTCKIAHVWDNGYNEYSAHYDSFDISGMKSELLEFASKQNEEQYVEGDHCRYCPAIKSCEAKVAFLNKLAGGEKLDVAYDRLRVLEGILEQARKDLTLLANTGPIPLSNGKQLVTTEMPGKLSFSTSKAKVALAELGRDPAEFMVRGNSFLQMRERKVWEKKVTSKGQR